MLVWSHNCELGQDLSTNISRDCTLVVNFDIRYTAVEAAAGVVLCTCRKHNCSVIHLAVVYLYLK